MPRNLEGARLFLIRSVPEIIWRRGQNRLEQSVARDTLFKTILATPPDDFWNAPDEEQARALEITRHILPISEREKGIWNDAAISASIPRYDLEKFRVPTIVISAKDDLYGTYWQGRYTAEHIPGARFVGYATGGHLLLGHSKETYVELSRFLHR